MGLVCKKIKKIEMKANLWHKTGAFEVQVSPDRKIVFEDECTHCTKQTEGEIWCRQEACEERMDAFQTYI